MARHEDDVLTECPTCGTPNAISGLRDYSSWLYDLLPGRVGASDIDAIIDQNFSGRALALEFKPNRYVPRGQALLFDRLIQGGFDVWLVIDENFAKDELEMCIWQPEKRWQNWSKVSVEEFRQAVRSWWELGEMEAA